MRQCPICGAAHVSCGPSLPVTAVGSINPVPKEDPMTLREYTVVINGVETTAQLTPQHAARLGAKEAAVENKSAAADVKARKAQNKGG